MTIHPYEQPGAADQTTRLQSLIPEKITKFNTNAATSYLRWYRTQHPEATPREVLDALEARFWKLSATAGGSVGAIAAVPVVGTGTALGISAIEAVGFLEASFFYIVARAELHGLPTDDLMRRQTLMMTILLGKAGEEVLTKGIGRTSNHWAKAVLTRTPAKSLRAVNSVLGRNMITKYGTKQGVIVLGRVIPFGIGAAIGGTLGAVSARGVMAAADAAFGPPPEDFSPAGPIKPHAPDLSPLSALTTDERNIA